MNKEDFYRTVSQCLTVDYWKGWNAAVDRVFDESKIMITKEQFCSIMQRITNQYDKNEEWFHEAEKFASGITLSLIDHDYYEILLDALKIAMNDKHEWIEHLMTHDFDGWSWFSVWDKNEIEYKIDSFEKLYDLITNEEWEEGEWEV